MWSAGFLPSTVKGRMHSFHCSCAPHRVPPVWHCHDTEGIGEESSETLRLDFNNLGNNLRMETMIFGGVLRLPSIPTGWNLFHEHLRKATKRSICPGRT